jgi:hypothetical protein
MRATKDEYETLRGKNRDIRFIEVGKFFDHENNVEKIDFEYDSKAYQRSREANVLHFVDQPTEGYRVLMSNRI